MIFGYFTLAVALIISTVAEYYSIVGLMAIFAASPISIAIMGAALGVGKITGAVWLKINWARANWKYKLYLSFAVTLLMMLTSVGCFGFLSKAHSDQNLVSGDVQAKIAVYDEKIKTAKDNIDANRKALKQMDEAVDQVMGRSNDEKGADKAVAIRRGQQKERARLQTEITTEQKTISQLSEERAPIAAEVRKVEAEVGPIKYIAAMIYGDNPDANLLEAAVRWVIILIVAVFDPLALMLNLAALQSIRWSKEEKTDKHEPEVIAPAYEPDDGPLTEEQLEQIKAVAEEELPGGEVITKTELFPEQSIFDRHPYLLKPFSHFTNTTPMVHTPEPIVEEVKGADEAVPNVERPGDYITASEDNQSAKIPETLKRVKVMAPSAPDAINVRKQLEPDNVVVREPTNGFGSQFPNESGKGDMFLRVDYLPNRLFKYNGNKWIEVDKDKTDSYTYDEQYINFLIEKLKTGEYEIDQLSAAEQELVAQKLQQ